MCCKLLVLEGGAVRDWKIKWDLEMKCDCLGGLLAFEVDALETCDIWKVGL